MSKSKPCHFGTFTDSSSIPGLKMPYTGICQYQAVLGNSQNVKERPHKYGRENTQNYKGIIQPCSHGPVGDSASSLPRHNPRVFRSKLVETTRNWSKKPGPGPPCRCAAMGALLFSKA
jgi:hypothetical protein